MKEIRTADKGFSLIELIVVIAIMAVLTAVLAPALLQYVEKSRAQKDDSAMGELTNAIRLACASQDVWDEVLAYTCYGNYSCYVDSDSEKDESDPKTIRTSAKIVTKAAFKNSDTSDTELEQYMFDDDARLLDEVEYYFAGNMRGVTITFHPQTSANKSTFELKNGVVNNAIGYEDDTVGIVGDNNEANKEKDGQGEAEGDGVRVVTDGNKAAVRYVNGEPEDAASDTKICMSEMVSSAANTNHYLYNAVRATVEDKIKLTSQTYRNSDYTVFIRMGSTGGNQADAQDAIAVYGQWNGTNLAR